MAKNIINTVSRPHEYYADQGVANIAEAHHYEKTNNCDACGEDHKDFVIFKSEENGRPDPHKWHEITICKNCISDAQEALNGIGAI